MGSVISNALVASVSDPPSGVEGVDNFSLMTTCLTPLSIIHDSNIADRVVLTGWSRNSGFDKILGFIFATVQPRLANLLDPARFGRYDNGAIDFVDIYAYIQT